VEEILILRLLGVEVDFDLVEGRFYLDVDEGVAAEPV